MLILIKISEVKALKFDIVKIGMRDFRKNDVLILYFEKKKFKN